MAQDQPESFSSELNKNAKKGAMYELAGAGTGAALGSAMAASNGLKGWQFFWKAVDVAVLGLMFGWVGRMWTERSANQLSAFKLDTKMMHLEQENQALKEKVVELSGSEPQYKTDHAEKIAAEPKDCGCQQKH